jgi:hypothetical protein
VLDAPSDWVAGTTDFRRGWRRGELKGDILLPVSGK